MKLKPLNPIPGGLDVVVIGRNEARHLPRVLAAVRLSVERLKARYSIRVEIHYIDSGSTDDSADVAAAQGARVWQAHPDYHTAANGRASGLALTEGEFVFLLDGDCEVHPDWLAVGLDYLLAHPRVGGVGGLGDSVRQVGGRAVRVRDRRSTPPEGAEVYDHIGTGGHGFLARRAALEQAGGYEVAQTAQEEALLYCKMRGHGWAVRRLGAPMMTHLDDDLESAGRGLGKLRGLVLRNAMSMGTTMRHALLEARVGPQILAFYRLQLAHGLWLLTAGGLLAVTFLANSGGSGWAAGLLTAFYAGYLYRRKQSVLLTITALPLLTVYVVGICMGFALNRPRTDWGVQNTPEYRAVVAKNRAIPDSKQGRPQVAPARH
ncbi:MAG: glycosyltransferase family 2 protein [Chloroflexi bacterium]|nr:glycosyltransferase family 2 protein [Chloroflexota bacterium]